MNIEEWGLIGIFIAGAIPWMEAISVVPAGIIIGLDPVATLISAIVGNSITIVLFAYFASNIRARLINKKVKQGKSAELPKLEKALKAFDKYGVYGLAALGPILIGTQFAAAASVAAGVKPLKVTVLVSAAMVIWAAVIAWVVVALGISVFEA